MSHDPYDLRVFKGPVSKSDQLPAKRKKYRRTVASPKRWAAIIATKAEACRACDATADVDAHHIVRKGSPHFGADTEANVIGLCRDCHTDYHAGRDKVRKILRHRFTDAEEAYANTRAYEGYLDDAYWSPWKEKP